MAASITCKLKESTPGFTWADQPAHVIEHHKMAQALESDCLSSTTCQLGDLKQVTYVLCYETEKIK